MEFNVTPATVKAVIGTPPKVKKPTMVVMMPFMTPTRLKTRRITSSNIRS